MNIAKIKCSWIKDGLQYLACKLYLIMHFHLYWCTKSVKLALTLLDFVAFGALVWWNSSLIKTWPFNDCIFICIFCWISINVFHFTLQVEMVYSLLSMLGSNDKDDMSRTLLAMSSSQDSCIAMRQSGRSRSHKSMSQNNCIAMRQSGRSRSQDSCIAMRQSGRSRSQDSCIAMRQSGRSRSHKSMSQDSCIAMRQSGRSRSRDGCIAMRRSGRSRSHKSVSQNNCIAMRQSWRSMSRRSRS